jgi:hypothetical protein
MKTITTLAATLSAALLLSGTPVLAAEATSQQTGPIHIDGAQLYGQNIEDEDSDGSVPNSVKIQFTNTNAMPATDIVFALESNGVVIGTVEDAGSFASGVKVSHTFFDDELSDSQQVAVEKVTFADGHVWNSPDVPASPGTEEGDSVNATTEF